MDRGVLFSTLDGPGSCPYNTDVGKLARLRAEKKRLMSVRDAALGTTGRMRSAASQAACARKVFMAGMTARGFSKAAALRIWRGNAASGR